MKWLLHNMTRAPKMLIFVPALGLTVFGLLTANNGSIASFSAIFLVFIVGLIMLVYWNFFSANNKHQQISRSNPGVVQNQLIEDSSEPVEINHEGRVPNPLDKGLDIPLM